MILGVIRLLHIALFLLLSAAALYVAFCGAVGRAGRLRNVAIAACAIELGVLALNGWRCPLTSVTGSVADLFLPAWSMRFVFPVFGAVFGFGLMLIAIRALVRRG